jgi:lysophospholipase L1-like esterase
MSRRSLLPTDKHLGVFGTIPRFRLELVVALAWAVTLGACEASAPASSRRTPTPTARDWTGTHEAPAAVGSAAAPDSAKETWVLHVGDSFVDASFSQNLAPRFRAAGIRQVAMAKTATYTTSWAYDSAVDRMLARSPALVVVTLGANEVDNFNPKLHAGAVRGLARKIGAAAPCVWVTPPLWKADASGWLQVIHDSCAPCLFFDSDAVLGGLKVEERRRDRIHPNERGGERWAEAFWGWLEDHKDRARGGWALVPYETR